MSKSADTELARLRENNEWLNERIDVLDAELAKARQESDLLRDDFEKARQWNQLCEMQVRNLQSIAEDEAANMNERIDVHDAELAKALDQNELLREELDWQNARNNNPAACGAYEFYINEEWEHLARMALDSDDATSTASLMKRRYDPDDERVRVRRVNADDAIISELAKLREENERIKLDYSVLDLRLTAEIESKANP